MSAPMWFEELVLIPLRRVLYSVPPCRGLHRRLREQIRRTCELRRRLAELGEDVRVD